MAKGGEARLSSLALLEFTIGLARRMQDRARPVSQAQLARLLGVSAPYISSVMSGLENLTVEQMSRLAAALGCAIHIAVVPKGIRVRWIEDVLAAGERPAGLDLERVEAHGEAQAATPPSRSGRGGRKPGRRERGSALRR